MGARSITNETTEDALRMLRVLPNVGRYGVEVEVGDLPHHVLIFKMFDKETETFRAFCAGSIIREDRVLSSTNCFLTNRKALRYDLDELLVVGAILRTELKLSRASRVEQRRKIKYIYSQRFYRFPAYNLGLLIVDPPWILNQYVNLIPYETEYHDYDGVCLSTSVKATRSWSRVKFVYLEEVEMVKRRTCEEILFRGCRNYLCTDYNIRHKYAFSETEGGGLVCRDTGDPAETNRGGILVGVTSVINLGLPDIHMRIGNHAKWVRDTSCRLIYNIYLLYLCLILTLINGLLS